jgi:hypothetical protein
MDCGTSLGRTLPLPDAHTDHRVTLMLASSLASLKAMDPCLAFEIDVVSLNLPGPVYNAGRNEACPKG